MSRGAVQSGDIGTIFEITLTNAGAVLDISNATGVNDKYMLFKKPDSSTLQKDSVFVTDGTDGKMNYTGVDGDLDQVGTWEIQGWANLGSGSWYSSIGEFACGRDIAEVTGI